MGCNSSYMNPTVFEKNLSEVLSFILEVKEGIFIRRFCYLVKMRFFKNGL